MEGNSIRTFENLCKIFEMRIKLDRENNKNTSEEVLINYEKYSKKIDAFYNKEFEEEIRTLITPELTLEEEQKRLKKLIRLLEERIEKRKSLEDNYYLTTEKYIKGLQTIISDSELNEKKERLNQITKYLDTKSEIESINESIINLRNSLFEEETKKEEYSSKNRILEDELYSVFTSMIKEEEYYRDINEEDINKELNDLLDKVRETKETLDITKESVSSLKVNGLEDDYSSYIEDAEKNYYIWKNREIILSIYNLVINFEEEFNDIYRKRNEIKELLVERQDLRQKLNVNDIDTILDFEKIVLEQVKVLDNEKEILENISNYTSRIKFKEDRLSELEEINNSIEILAILREYGVIDTYESEELELLEEEPIVKEVFDPYRIVEIKDYPKTLNIGLAKLKGENIRDKVNKKLNPVVEEKTFEDLTINLEKEEEKIEVQVEENNEVLTSDDNKNIPVWEIHSDITTEKVVEQKEEINNPLPVWDIKPVENIHIPEEPSNIEIIPRQSELKEETVNNMFWIPVSEEKLETNQFPSINIPIQSNFINENDNFGFPDIK